MSGICNTAGYCTGKSVNEPCSDSSECDVSLGCTPIRVFPFNTICKSLLSEGETCINDYQCTFGLVCSYLNTNSSYDGTMTCMKKDAYADGATLGYQSLFNDVYKDSLYYG